MTPTNITNTELMRIAGNPKGTQTDKEEVET